MQPPIKPTTPPMGDAPTAFSQANAGRVAETVRQVERQYRNGPVRTAREPRGGSDGGWLYKLSGTLSNASALTSVTNASAVPQVFSGTTLSDGSASVTLYNYHDKTFASGAIVFAEYGPGGKLWVIDVRSCSNVS